MDQSILPLSQAWLQPCYSIENQNIKQLRKILKENRKAQQQLKEMRNSIKQRLNILDEFLMTYKVQNQYPQPQSLISYLKFQRNVPPSYTRQMKIYQNGRMSHKRSASKKKNETKLFLKLNKNVPQNRSPQYFFEQQQLQQDQGSSQQCIHVDKSASPTLKKGQHKKQLQNYRKWCNQNMKRKVGDKFNSQQDRMILQKKKIYRDSWQKIGQFINHRLTDQICYQYSNRLNPNVIHGRWTLTHTIMLIILIEHFGFKKWSRISEKIVVKNQLQVRQRFCNLIDPNIGKDIWTFQMQKKLLEIAEDYDFCWKKISMIPFFNNKTDNCVWRKWKQLMMRFTREQIHIMLPKIPKYRKLAEKVIKDKQTFQKKKRAPGSKLQPPIYFGRFKDKESFTTYIFQHGFSSQPNQQLAKKGLNSRNQRPSESNQSFNLQLSQAQNNNNLNIDNQQQQMVKAQYNFMSQQNGCDEFLGEYEEDQPDYIIYETKK